MKKSDINEAALNILYAVIYTAILIGSMSAAGMFL